MKISGQATATFGKGKTHKKRKKFWRKKETEIVYLTPVSESLNADTVIETS